MKPARAARRERRSRAPFSKCARTRRAPRKDRVRQQEWRSSSPTPRQAPCRARSKRTGEGCCVLKTLANLALSRVRPGKRIADEIGGLDLLVYALEQMTCAVRGALLSLRCARAAPCFIGRGVRLRFARRIVMGRHATIGDGAILSGLGLEGLRLGSRVNVGAYSRLVVGTDIARPGSYIRIGDNAGIGEYSSIGGSGGVSIGANTIIGQYFSAHPENHNHEDLTRPIRTQGTTRAPISIGEDCWFGARVTVLAGVTIGDGCVIAAGSVVTRDIPARSIAAGIPARVIRARQGESDDRA
jgi:acetyltransferase-like isoleucine patch superfamily enzyme